MTPRELMKATLNFENKTGRVPRDLWTVPWANEHEGEMLRKVQEDFPVDIVTAPGRLSIPTISKGDPHVIGTHIDPWGCKFTNIQSGVIGEVKDALVQDEDWDDWENVHIPTELLSFNIDDVNAYCRNTDKYVKGSCCPRPFEQLQFIRTTEDLLADLVDPPKNMLLFMDKMFAFYCELMEKWAKTEVDALMFMDDWGSQNSLLINPVAWDKYFRPFYQEFIDIAHRNGKDIFMHSDGNTLLIYPKLIEMGLDAFNSQIFCMGLDNLEQYKGKITFWGEIDRQHMLPNGSVRDIENAVKEVYDRLWDNGGCIAQCEFGPGAKGENVYAVYNTWNSLRK